MKKSILIALLGLGTAVASYGQGQIAFNNYVSYGQPNGVIYGTTAGPANGWFAGSEISVTLFWGASTDTQFSQLTAVAGSTTAVGGFGPVGPGPSTTTGAGQFSGPVLTINGGVPGTFAFAIYATGTYLGITYISETALFNGPTSATLLNLPTLLPAGLLNGNIVLDIIPEPSTMALGVLGGLSLLMFRRKQS